MEACLEALARNSSSETSLDVSLLKTCQILVFNLAVHGVGTRKLWNHLMQVYEARIMRDHRFNGGSFHIFSLIGFMTRSQYIRVEPERELLDSQESVEFEERLGGFIGRYKEFAKKYIKPESLTLSKYEDVQEIYVGARVEWRRDATIFKHKEMIDIIKEL